MVNPDSDKARHGQLLAKLGATTHEEAIRRIAYLQERSGVLAWVCKRLGVDDHWGVREAMEGGVDGE